MSTSSVLTVVPALVAKAAAVMPGRAVVDGPPLNNQGQHFGAIGWNGEDAAIQLVQDPASFDARSNRESYDVISQLVSWYGAVEQAPLRARLFADLDALNAALIADRTLGGTCMAVALTESVYAPTQTNKGAMATLTFTIHVDAWRTP